MKRSILTAAASGAIIGGIVAGAVMRLPEAKPVPVARGASSTARIAPQPPLSPAGLPGPIIWDRDQIDLAPLEVRKAWQTPAYTIRDNATGRVVFSPAQRGGE